MSRRVKIATSDASDKYRDHTSEEEAAADADAIANAKEEEDYLKVKYKDDPKKAYGDIGDQLDMQYKDQLNGTTTWKDHVAKVKSDHPKPE